ncbi:TonB-dependent receptor domain-containing protein [Sphaerotilus hippei]|nr:TonB-dependent receptor [Sphaerotilus hippei]
MSDLSRRLVRPSRPVCVSVHQAPPLSPRRVALACATVLIGAATVPARAAEALDPVIISATRVPQRISQAIADVSVFSREDLDRRATGNVADLLRSAAGFEISRNGGPGGITSCFVRGAESRFVAVLIDGVRVDSQSTGGAPWEALPLSQIDRIEVVRGGVGAIYGSDALGGVVQIFTRKGEPGLAFDFGAGLGNNGLRKLDARVSGRSGEFDYALGVAGERAGGFSAITNPANSSYSADDDGYQNRGGSARLGWQLSPTQRVEAGLTSAHSNSQYDGYPAGVDHHAFHNFSSADLNWSAQWLPEWRSQVTLGQSVDQYKTRPSAYDTRTRIRTATWLNTLSLGEHTVSATLERREDQLDNSGVLDGRAGRAQNALAVGDQWHHGALALQAHVRQDHDSEFGGHTTGLLGAAYELAPGWRVRASAGNSFRAPTLYQRFSEYGKAGLSAEQGFNVEAGLNWREGVNHAGLTVYRNRVRDLIVYESVTGTSPCASLYGCYNNVGVARLQGLTLEGGTELGAVRLSGSIDALSPRNADASSANNGKLLTRRARRHASLKADTDLGDWTLGAQVLASGTRYDNAANTATRRLAGYTVLNLDAQWRFARDWRLEARVDNLFDQAYESAQYYSVQQRQLYVGLRWSPRI